jgi:hypothetical protein
MSIENRVLKPLRQRVTKKAPHREGAGPNIALPITVDLQSAFSRLSGPHANRILNGHHKHLAVTDLTGV